MINYKNIKLKQKITCAIIAILIIPTLVIALIGYSYITQQYEKDTYNSALAVSNQYKDQIEKKINSINIYMTNLANNTYLNSFLGWEYSNDYLSLALFKDIEKYLVASNTVNTHVYDTLNIYYTNTSIPEKYPLFLRYSQLDKKYHRDQVTDDEDVDMFLEEDQIIFIKSIRSNLDQSLLGVIEISIEKAHLFGTLEVYLDNPMSMLILDLDNKLVFPHDAKESSIQKNDLIQTMIMGENLIIEDALTEYNLKIVTSIPEKYIMSGTRSAFKGIAIYLIVGMFLLIAAIYVIVDVFLYRLKDLSAAMVSFSKGDFDVVVAERTHDEIGQIIRTFNSMTKDINSLNKSILEKERQRQEADVKALRAQINPHFIYNTIEIFRTQADKHQDYKLSSGLYAMGKMLRYSTNWIENSTLKKELEHIGEYLKLVSSIKNEIRVSINGDDAILDCKVPKMLLQPIIENSIEHGMRQTQKLHIDINYFRREDTIIIEIYDDGIGIEKNRLQQINDDLLYGGKEAIDCKSIALRNINERLGIRYGYPYGLHIDSTQGICTQVVIKIPYEKVMEVDDETSYC